MSPEISLNGHQSKGHDKCPPVPVVVENTSVRVGGKAVACVGDALQPHGCDDHSPHQGKISAGAPHVRIAGRKVARKGDSIDCGPALDELAEGAKCVRVGNCGGEEWGREFVLSMLKNKNDLLVLCLSEIAANEAARTRVQGNKIDHQGWLYFHEAVLKWTNTKAGIMPDDKFHNGCQDPLFIEWEWLMQYKRFQRAVEELKKPEYFLSPVEQSRMTRLLRGNEQEESAFVGKGRSFNHININWDQWRRHAITGYPISISLKNAQEFKNAYELFDKTALLWGQTKPDAFQALLANTTVYAVTSGRTEHRGNGIWRVYIHELAAFVHDGFDFNGDQWLGNWICTENYIEPGTGIVIGPKKEFDMWGLPLNNKAFRHFRESTGYGCDFRTMCVPQVVWTGEVWYDAVL